MDTFNYGEWMDELDSTESESIMDVAKMPMTMNEERTNNLSTKERNRFLLDTQSVDDSMIKSIRLYSVMGDEQITVAFHKLHYNHSCPLPIYQSTKNKTLLGFIEALDLVRLVIELVCPYIEKYKEIPIDDQALGEMELIWNGMRCEEVCRKGQNPQLSPGATLTTAIEVMGLMGHSRQLSVVGSSPEYEFYGIVMQSTLLRHLFTILDLTDPIFTKTIQDIEIGSKSVIVIEENLSLINAFKLCTENNITGIGVVDHDGNLIGNVSVSDFQSLQSYKIRDIIEFCMRPCGWLKRYRAEESFQQPISVESDTLIKDLISVFISTNVHRVYVIDHHTQKPTSIISLYDIISLFKSD